MTGLRYPVLAVLTGDGAPNQSVMWFDLDPEQPDTILMNTKVGRAKERFLRSDPRISLCFEEELTWVAFQGRAELDDDRERRSPTSRRSHVAMTTTRPSSTAAASHDPDAGREGDPA